MKRRHTLYLAVLAALGTAMQPGSAVAQQETLNRQETLKGQRAQSGSPELATDKDSHHYFTVLTMAPDGEWGVATEMFINRAIAGAISNCKAMSGTKIGCGAQFTNIRAGWSLAIRCGNQNIIVAAKALLEAEQAAIDREISLRQLYVPNMSPCVRVVSVDPHGNVVAPNASDLLRMVAHR